MNRTRTRGVFAAAVVAMALCAGIAPVHAQSALPEVKVDGAVQFLSGGIGADETAAIKAASKRYALTVLFAETRSGHDVYLASVSVTIRDAGGQIVLHTVTEGPYLLVNLPAGRYRFSAEHAGLTRQLALDIKDGVPQRHSLVWPYTEQSQDPEPAAPTVGAEMDLTAALPPLRMAGGIPYRSGGVGEQESQALRSQFRNYALSLTFAATLEGRNAFLASVQVRIADGGGTTLAELTTEGPFLVIDLPPGPYEVVASYEGREQRAKIRVEAGKPVQRAFVWN